MYSNLDYYKSLLSNYDNCKNLNNLKVLESEETIEYLLNNEVSFIRWGCGESNHVLGGQNPTQDYNEKLSSALKDIAFKYNSDSKYLLGIPSIYIKKNKNKFQDLNKSIKNQFSSSRYLFDKYGKPELVYGDAFVFRPERDIHRNLISKLWEEKYTILLCGSENNSQFIANKTNSKEHFFIKTPKTNSFSQVDSLIKKTITTVNKLSDRSNVRVLVACGPAAKVIAYHLSNENIVTYDVGNFFMGRT